MEGGERGGGEEDQSQISSNLGVLGVSAIVVATVPNTTWNNRMSQEKMPQKSLYGHNSSTTQSIHHRVASKQGPVAVKVPESECGSGL